ncbi:MAG: LysM peptidoglycan-binding domain-containing protein, partial [Planctomycetes bacterium]|nr:LysM peptidoglycan-binding domain-containing protein [Planctomycetota bacterium]
MRRRYRRRSTASWVLWGILFFGGTAAMAWQLGWLPDESDLFELAVRGRQTDTETQSDQANSAPAKHVDEDRILFGETPSKLLSEEEVYRRLVEQTRKRRNSRSREPSPELFSAQQPNRPYGQSVQSHLSRDDDGRRVIANFPVRNSLFQRPQTSSQDDNASGSQIVPAGNDVLQSAFERTTTSTVPSLPGALQSRMSDIDQLILEGKTLSAHRELSRLYWSHPGYRDVFAKRIEKTALSIYFSPQPHFMPPYRVQPGDQLRRVAKLYNVPWEYIEKLNRIDARRIRPGQDLKVIKGPFSAIIELSRFELTVHTNGYFVHRYSVGIGKDGTTPVGKFRVQNKVVNPQYTGPDNRVIAADDPANPLG